MHVIYSLRNSKVSLSVTICLSSCGVLLKFQQICEMCTLTQVGTLRSEVSADSENYV